MNNVKIGKDLLSNIKREMLANWLASVWMKIIAFKQVTKNLCPFRTT